MRMKSPKVFIRKEIVVFPSPFMILMSVEFAYRIGERVYSKKNQEKNNKV